MNSLVKETHKITIGRTTQQLLKDFRDQGHKITKGYLLTLTNTLKLKERGLVSVISQMTTFGMRPHNIYNKEAVKEIIMKVNKMFPKEKEQYLIESTKPKSMSLAVIKQVGLALIGLSENIENQQKQIEDLQNQQNMCRVSAVKDNELRKISREIIEHRLHKKGLVYEDNSARSTEYAYLFSYLNKESGISRITNLNAEEHQIVRDKLLDIMEWERIPY